MLTDTSQFILGRRKISFSGWHLSIFIPIFVANIYFMGLLGVLGAAAPIISGLGSFFTQKETNNANLELAKYQNDWNLQQWNRENEYNSPSQQMARLQEAGLNPNLVYANGGSTTSSAHSPSAAQMSVDNPFKQLPTHFNDFIGNLLQVRKQNAEIENIHANTNRTNMESSMIPYQIEQMGVNNALTTARTFGVNAENTEKKLKSDYYSANPDLFTTSLQQQLHQKWLSNVLTSKQVEEKNKRIELVTAELQQMPAKLQGIILKNDVLRETISNLIINGDLTNKQWELAQYELRHLQTTGLGSKQNGELATILSAVTKFINSLFGGFHSPFRDESKDIQENSQRRSR